MAIAITIAAVGGYFVGQKQTHQPDATSQPSERKVLYWYDPMVPGQRFDKPGLHFMDMDLVPRYASERRRRRAFISTQQQQNLGMKPPTLRCASWFRRSRPLPRLQRMNVTSRCCQPPVAWCQNCLLMRRSAGKSRRRWRNCGSRWTP
ncbi:MAG: hypothetical protein ACLTXH_10955 [Enterobacter hormaechei]